MQSGVEEPTEAEDDPAASCAFTTGRLDVGEWRVLAGRYGLDRVEIVRAVLTEATTGELPPGWQGDYDNERADAWIAERDAESPTLLVIDQRSAEPVGLVLLFAVPHDGSGEIDDAVDVRLGYVLAESAWGQGLATEVVGGIVAWAQRHPSVATMSGGVSRGNPASARVLVKNGFTVESVADGEQLFVRSVM